MLHTGICLDCLDCPDRSLHSMKLELFDQEKERRHRDRQSSYGETTLEEISFSFQTGDVLQRKRTRNESGSVVSKDENCFVPEIKHISPNNDIVYESQDHSQCSVPEAEESSNYDRSNNIQEESFGDDVTCEGRSPSLRSVHSLGEGLSSDVDDLANAFNEPGPGTCTSVTDVSFEGFSVESSPRSTLSQRSITVPYTTPDAELHLLTNGQFEDPEHRVLCSSEATNLETQIPHQSANSTDLKCLRLEKELSNLSQRVRLFLSSLVGHKRWCLCSLLKWKNSFMN